MVCVLGLVVCGYMLFDDICFIVLVLVWVCEFCNLIGVSVLVWLVLDGYFFVVDCVYELLCLYGDVLVLLVGVW